MTEKKGSNRKKFAALLVILILIFSIVIGLNYLNLPTPTIPKVYTKYTSVPSSKANIDWNDFWQTVNTYSDWDLEYSTSPNKWTSIKSDLDIIKDFIGNETCKITLNFTASQKADYRLTFGINLDVGSYIHKEDSWNYTISYSQYTVNFDWSDVKDIPNLQISHGIKDVVDERWFWFRIRRDNIPEGAHVEIDPTISYVEEMDYFPIAGVDGGWTDFDIYTNHDVPKGAVVEIIAVNRESDEANYAGVRTDGSSVERKLLLHEAENPVAGTRVTARFLVTVDPSTGLIEYYDTLSSLQNYYILGYWEGIDFTETWIDLNVIKADESTWVDRNLFTGDPSIPKGSVALASLVNRAPGNEYNIGVRTDGSGLARITDIHEAEGGGVNVVSMFVKTSMADGIIEIWCEDESPDCSVIIQGYFGSDMDFVELFTQKDVIQSSTWEEHDLSGDLDQDGRVCDFLITHNDPDLHHSIAVRTNGSDLDSRIAEHEAEGGGYTGYGVSVQSDESGIVEFYILGDATFDYFLLTGYFKFEVEEEHLTYTRTYLTTCTSDGSVTIWEIIEIIVDPTTTTTHTSSVLTTDTTETSCVTSVQSSTSSSTTCETSVETSETTATVCETSVTTSETTETSTITSETSETTCETSVDTIETSTTTTATLTTDTIETSTTTTDILTTDTIETTSTSTSMTTETLETTSTSTSETTETTCETSILTSETTSTTCETSVETDETTSTTCSTSVETDETTSTTCTTSEITSETTLTTCITSVETSSTDTTTCVTSVETSSTDTTTCATSIETSSTDTTTCATSTESSTSSTTTCYTTVQSSTSSTTTCDSITDFSTSSTTTCETSVRSSTSSTTTCETSFTTIETCETTTETSISTLHTTETITITDETETVTETITETDVITIYETETETITDATETITETSTETIETTMTTCETSSKTEKTTVTTCETSMFTSETSVTTCETSIATEETSVTLLETTTTTSTDDTTTITLTSTCSSYATTTTDTVTTAFTTVEYALAGEQTAAIIVAMLVLVPIIIVVLFILMRKRW